MGELTDKIKGNVNEAIGKAKQHSDEIRALYNDTASHYDRASLLYRITGVERVREQLINDLQLTAESRVIDLGTGTGVNLPLLAARAGDVIGVDLSPGMLAKAQERINDQRLHNVALIESNLHLFNIPADIDAAVATFSLEFVPDYAGVIARLASAIKPGGRFALMGLKYPEKWPNWMADIGIAMNRSFGVTRDLKDNQPWRAAQMHFKTLRFQELYWGSAYLWLGEKSGSG